jgi:hypothetical protein
MPRPSGTGKVSPSADSCPVTPDRTSRQERVGPRKIEGEPLTEAALSGKAHCCRYGFMGNTADRLHG